MPPSESPPTHPAPRCPCLPPPMPRTGRHALSAYDGHAQCVCTRAALTSLQDPTGAPTCPGAAPCSSPTTPAAAAILLTLPHSPQGVCCGREVPAWHRWVLPAVTWVTHTPGGTLVGRVCAGTGHAALVPLRVTQSLQGCLTDRIRAHSTSMLTVSWITPTVADSCAVPVSPSRVVVRNCSGPAAAIPMNR